MQVILTEEEYKILTSNATRVEAENRADKDRLLAFCIEAAENIPSYELDETQSKRVPHRCILSVVNAAASCMGCPAKFVCPHPGKKHKPSFT